MVFVVHLKETTVTENNTVTLECQISKPGHRVIWFKDGKEIKRTDRREIQIDKKDKTWHRLIITKSQLDDEAEYSAKVANDVTKATLWVEGRSNVKQRSTPPVRGWLLSSESFQNTLQKG